MRKSSLFTTILAAALSTTAIGGEFQAPDASANEASAAGERLAQGAEQGSTRRTVAAGKAAEQAPRERDAGGVSARGGRLFLGNMEISAP